jgi:uncharacterized protein
LKSKRSRDRSFEMKEKLVDWFGDRDGAVIAFSGGVDSCVVAKAAKEALGDRAIAVTSDSKTFPDTELDHAKKLAREIGIKHEIVKENELKNPLFVKNPKNRCYQCRKGLIGGLKVVADRYNIATIVDGANADDTGEHRPGMRAMKEAGVRSPLLELGFTKIAVRDIAKKFALSTHEKPAMACLASRIPYGERITKEKLHRIEKAEGLLRSIGLSQMRVRHHDSTARIEVPQDEIPAVLENRADIVERFKRLGFAYVTLDIEGYRSGSMDEVL